MEKLKPCPFCGGEAELITRNPEVDGTWSVYEIWCKSCAGRYHEKEGADYGIDLMICGNNLDVIADVWNARAERTCKMTESFDIGVEFDPFDGWSCSECKMIVSYEVDKPNYCPNCGAKVVE